MNTNTIYWWDIPEVKNAYDNGKDFTGVDLTNVCFTHEKTTKEIVLLDLAGANFKGCDLSSVMFYRADVRGADFTGLTSFSETKKPVLMK